ncbi:Bacterial transcriptional activator domain [Micromonospora nigra]|uniref:Bacterial transcriptional activator domain n=2 Tax=Micromonospora nigra TaxID=145857 RepID=A0A1C6SAS9_9ACTN|nr:Bacterial transcriptional activator domain [Micromonospora nigra]
MSLLFVLALLTGPPVVLLVLIGPPVRGWPTREQARAWLQEPLTEQTLTAGLTIGAWLLWLLLAYTVAVRVLTRLRATVVWLRRLPLPTPLQATASGMAGAAVFGVTTNTATTTPPPPPPPTTGVSEQPERASPLHDDSAARDDGIVVSGGWLPREVAEQVAAAAALIWLRRRRDYVPRPPGPHRRQEPDTEALPPTVTAVQAALADAPAPPAAQMPADSLAALTGILPAGGLGLTGPGALPIGRGLLVTVLLAGPRHPNTTLVTTRTTLTSLLGPEAETLGRRLPHLTIVEDLDDAARIIESADTSRIVILAADDYDRHDMTHLISAATTGASRLVVLGEGPGGPTWHADSTGHLHDPSRPETPRPRLCVLDQVAATDLLTIIAHPDPTPPALSAPRPHLPPAMPPGPRLPRQTTRGKQPRPSTAPRQRLQLRILGEPTLLIDGEPLTIRRSAALQILVYLATHPTGADTRQLTEAIWPGLPRRSPTGRLYTTLSDLRSSIRTATGLHVIDHTDDRYRLNPTHIDVDLWHLHAAIQRAAATVTDTTTAWQTILDAYPADLAAGRTWPWLDPQREAIRRHVIDTCVALADTEPDPQRTLALLQTGIHIDPYNANLHTRARNALITHGDHHAATEMHHRYLRNLAHAGLDDTPHPPLDREHGTASRRQ